MGFYGQNSLQNRKGNGFVFKVGQVQHHFLVEFINCVQRAAQGLRGPTLIL